MISAYHIIEKKGKLGDRLDGELLQALLPPQHDNLQGGQVGVALDDAGHVQVTPVPHVVLANLINTWIIS